MLPQRALSTHLANPHAAQRLAQAGCEPRQVGPHLQAGGQAGRQGEQEDSQAGSQSEAG